MPNSTPSTTARETLIEFAINTGLIGFGFALGFDSCKRITKIDEMRDLENSR